MSIAERVNPHEKIVKEYIPLVKYIASRVMIGKTKYVEYDDLVGYGMVGLMDAIHKYDESKGMKFTTYASIRIKGAIIDELRKNSPISKGAMDKLNKYNASVERLQKSFLREPSILEVAEDMNMSVNEVGAIENYINYIAVVSLEDMTFSDEDEVPLLGAIVDEKSPKPELIVEEEEKIKFLQNGIEELKEKDQTILSLYYYEGLTLKEIGKVLGVSESRVCQLHSRAIVNLRKSLKKLKYSIY